MGEEKAVVQRLYAQTSRISSPHDGLHIARRARPLPAPRRAAASRPEPERCAVRLRARSACGAQLGHSGWRRARRGGRAYRASRESLFTLKRFLTLAAARSRPLTARGWPAGGWAPWGGGVEAALARLVHHGNALAHARHLHELRIRAPLLSRVRRPPAARRVPLRQRGWPRAARAPRRLRRGGRRRRSRRAGRRRSARWLAGRVVPAHVPPRALPARHGRRRRVASGPDPRAPHEADLERRVDGATRRA